MPSKFLIAFNIHQISDTQCLILIIQQQVHFITNLLTLSVNAGPIQQPLQNDRRIGMCASGVIVHYRYHHLLYIASPVTPIAYCA